MSRWVDECRRIGDTTLSFFFKKLVHVPNSLSDSGIQVFGFLLDSGS